MVNYGCHRMGHHRHLRDEYDVPPSLLQMRFVQVLKVDHPLVELACRTIGELLFCRHATSELAHAVKVRRRKHFAQDNLPNGTRRAQHQRRLWRHLHVAQVCSYMHV